MRFYPKDDEANAFAAFLLMPNPQFARDIRGIDLNDDSAVQRLCRKYSVSVGPLVYRISLEDARTAQKEAP